jgi:hypothetical protein
VDIRIKEELRLTVARLLEDFSFKAGTVHVIHPDAQDFGISHALVSG